MGKYVAASGQRPLTQVRPKPLSDLEDIGVAVPLAILVHEELEKYGTASNQEPSEAEVRSAILALRSLRDPLSGHLAGRSRSETSAFRAYWLRHDGYGSWNTRRTL